VGKSEKGRRKGRKEEENARQNEVRRDEASSLRREDSKGYPASRLVRSNRPGRAEEENVESEEGDDEPELGVKGRGEGRGVELRGECAAAEECQWCTDAKKERNRLLTFARIADCKNSKRFVPTGNSSYAPKSSSVAFDMSSGRVERPRRGGEEEEEEREGKGKKERRGEGGKGSERERSSPSCLSLDDVVLSVVDTAFSRDITRGRFEREKVSFSSKRETRGKREAAETDARDTRQKTRRTVVSRERPEEKEEKGKEAKKREGKRLRRGMIATQLRRAAPDSGETVSTSCTGRYGAPVPLPCPVLPLD
jgi:hypothetical protein